MSAIKPVQRFWDILREDKRDLIVLIVYTVLSGLLSLVIPLTAQALVNTIAAGVFLQPLAVLTLILFVVLIFVGALRASQFFLVEILQRRIFAKVSLNLSERVPLIQHRAWLTEYMPEVMNRFFDVVNAQKTMAKILLEAPAALLQISIGLLLMAVYSPVLLAFDLFIIFFIIFVAFVLGKNGVNTSIQESEEKYRVAGWLEELARCQISFKVDGVPGYLYQRTDNHVVAYLNARRGHFQILFRQAIANHLFQALATAGILGIGGWLVIERQLTLGQLVASELVILILLTALEKLVALFQDWYDLLTSLTKIGHITDLPIERTDGIRLETAPNGIAVHCQAVNFSYKPPTPVLSNLSLTVQPGEVVSLVGPSGAGKSTLAAMLCGFLEPDQGLIELNGIDVRTLQLQSLRQSVSLVSDTNEIFEGTIAENIGLGRKNVSAQDIRWALEISQLTEKIQTLPEGMQTPLLSSGVNLSRGQKQKLMIARGIVSRPKLLILDEAFTGIDERKKLRILDALLSPDNQWTVIDISHDSDVVMRSHRMMVLSDGRIQETGPPKALIRNQDSLFASFFPELASRFGRRLK
ncbi:MAG: peptidase domain-containing ABC transporter [Candidatus Melainabacteria bacterium]